MSNSKMPREEREYLRYLRDLHFRMQGGLCYFCDCQMTDADVPNPKPGTTVTIEHLKPYAKGGGSNSLNTVAACLDCNHKRSRKYSFNNKLVPRVVVRRVAEFTVGYTTPSSPKVLTLYNTTQTKDVVEALKNLEKEPINIKFTEMIEE